MKSRHLFLFLLASATILASYQNCGNVSVSALAPAEQASLLQKSSHPVTLNICVPDDLGVPWNIFGSPFIVNLNALPDRGSYLPDSDIDGVPDSLESNANELLNSHSQNILDFFCFKSGTCTNTCSPTTSYYSLGLTRCDIQAFSSVSGGFNTFDSNKDSIPDFVQIIRKGDPFRPPNTDLDQDGRTLIQEIRDQTDPEWSDTSTEAAKCRPTVKTISNDSSCPAPAKHYLISSPDLPFVPVRAYRDPMSLTVGNLSFGLSHQENENVVGIFFTTASLSSPPTYRGYFYLGRIQDPVWTSGPSLMQELHLQNTDLIKAGEWQ